MGEEESHALEGAWQALLVQQAPVREQLNAGAMLRIAFEAGWNGGVAFRELEAGS